MSTSTRLERAVAAHYARIAKDLGPKIAAAGVDPAGSEGKAIIAQNVIKDVLQEIYIQIVPFDLEAVAQMATRSFSYALSIAPMEDQDELVHNCISKFADFHMLRCAQGIRLNGGWGTDDPNTPLTPNFED